MLKELFESVWGKALASKPPIVAIPNDARGRYLICREGTDYMVEDAEKPWRRMVSLSVPGLFACLQTVSFDEEHHCIYYDPTKIKLLFHRDEPREYAEMALSRTPQLNMIAAIEQGNYRRIPQESAIKLFQEDLPEHAEKDLLPGLRNVRFEKSEKGHSQMDSGNASLSREQRAKLVGAVAIPLVVNVRFDAFLEVPSEMRATLRLECDAANTCFRVTCEAGTYSRLLIAACERHLKTQLVEQFGEETLIIHGSI